MKGKMIKLLVLETHYKTLKSGQVTTSGVDYARLVLPATHLAKLPGFKVEIRKNPFTDKEKTWDDVTKAWDIIWTSYIDKPMGYVQMAFHAEKNDCKLVIDLDDNVWELPPENPVYKSYHPGSESLGVLSKILQNQDHITVSTSKLQSVVCRMCIKRHDQVKVLPNMIDLNAYDFNNIVRKDHPLTIAHFGSTTHFQDLMDPAFVSGMEQVLSKYKDVRFITVGNWVPAFQSKFGPQYRQIMGLGKPDVHQWINEAWPKLMGISDIIVAPLSAAESNKSKSDIKMLETGAAKLPFIGSRVTPYNNSIGVIEEVAYLAGTSKEWFTKLEKLILDEKLRKGQGEKLHEWVKNRSIQSNVQKWADYFSSIA